MGESLLERHKKPVCLIILGMAGSGKTTFVQQLTSGLHKRKTPPYVINLDPACREVPYPVNIDIRDTVNYKEVMKQYSLGPNGGIVTSLNLFATKFDQVIKLVEKRSETTDIAIFDTPGQIEVFTWSASGTIITETLAALFPTVVVYVMDVVRSVSPVTFMSNMLYACSILYKLRLPFIVNTNETTVKYVDFIIDLTCKFESKGVTVEDIIAEAMVSMRTRSYLLFLNEKFKEKRIFGRLAASCTSFAFSHCRSQLVSLIRYMLEPDSDRRPDIYQFLKSFVPPSQVTGEPFGQPDAMTAAADGAALVGHVAVWNPFDDSSPFNQLNEDHLAPAEDRSKYEKLFCYGYSDAEDELEDREGDSGGTLKQECRNSNCRESENGTNGNGRLNKNSARLKLTDEDSIGSATDLKNCCSDEETDEQPKRKYFMPIFILRFFQI
uniref:GPN-loop GTPase n=1 Tax=Ceriodaphnia reticulata TaxID=302197 RepID=A0A4Y7LZI9_9CRUS|nr:EOG090X072H [Ceriodaphnia reticulata]